LIFNELKVVHETVFINKNETSDVHGDAEIRHEEGDADVAIEMLPRSIATEVPQ
jgi:hypothetical protein